MNYQKLKALAEAGTPTRWSTSGSYIAPTREENGTTYVENWRSIALVSNDADRAFIAAANPAAVLELIADYDSARKHWENESRNVEVLIGELAGAQAMLETAQSERDQLKAENERLELENEDTLKKFEEVVEGFTKLSAEVLELRQQLAIPSDVLADAEALRRDAERYRWLRDDAVDPGTVIDKKVGVFNSEDGGFPIWEYRAGEELDCAIDAAMSKEASHD